MRVRTRDTRDVTDISTMPLSKTALASAGECKRTLRTLNVR